MYTLHSRLERKKTSDGDFNPDDEDFGNIDAAGINERTRKPESTASEERIAWLEHLKSWSDKELFSPHLVALTSLINELMESQPQRKIVVFS